MKFRLFVASSVEGLDVAYAVQENLEYDFEVTVWPQGVFGLTKSALEALDDQSKRFDAAAFVFSPHDTAIVRGTSKPAIRDNVVFELGLFIGRLGRDKCFVLKPRSFVDANFPSDLFGIIPASYDDDRQDGNVVAALGPACNKLRKALIPGGRPTTSNTDSLRDILTSRPFRLIFNPTRQFSKCIVFSADGKIIEGNNKNEHAWRIVEGKVELMQLDGRVHSRFIYDRHDSLSRHTNDSDTLSLRSQLIVPDAPDKSGVGV